MNKNRIMRKCENAKMRKCENAKMRIIIIIIMCEHDNTYIDTYIHTYTYTDC
jgi:hypothetical protein